LCTRFEPPDCLARNRRLAAPASALCSCLPLVCRPQSPFPRRSGPCPAVQITRCACRRCTL
jgi:hypothetical protein